MEDQNPWWKGKEKIKEDKDFLKWEQSKIKWTPSLIHEINLKPFSLHFIFGPRQVGKTTAIKLLIQKLLEQGVDPKAIFYYRCDQLADFRELEEILRRYEELREKWGIKTSFLFLDEVTMPTEWYRTIKFRIDSGKHEKDVLVLTG